MADIQSGVTSGLTGAASGAIVGAKIGAVGGPLGALIGGGIGLVAGLFGGKKAPAPKQVDISKLVADARANAEENLRRSLDLEKAYLPGQAAARTAASDFLLSQLTGAPVERREQLAAAASELARQRGVSTLTRSAADQILADLGLGGALDAETQAQVMRGALAKGGAAGIMGSDAGRGLLARDLGLTSIQLRNARQQAALQAGNQLDAAYLASLGLLGNVTGNQLTQAGQISSLMAGTPLPESGLSSGDLASVAIGDQNAINNYNAQKAAINANKTTNLLQAGLGFAGVMAGMSNNTPNTTPSFTGSGINTSSLPGGQYLVGDTSYVDSLLNR